MTFVLNWASTFQGKKKWSKWPKLSSGLRTMMLIQVGKNVFRHRYQSLNVRQWLQYLIKLWRRILTRWFGTKQSPFCCLFFLPVIKQTLSWRRKNLDPEECRREVLMMTTKITSVALSGPDLTWSGSETLFRARRNKRRSRKMTFALSSNDVLNDF